MVKKITIKILYLTTILTIIISFLIFVDVFNIFHYKKIRITSAEPNRNFVKTKYIIDNPDKFNAFIFGSSKIENIIPDFLPSKDENNTPLNWYNMEYSSGVPAEFAQTIESFLNNSKQIVLSQKFEQTKEISDVLDEVRDENKNVVESYTFDIKVLNEFDEEIQPSDGSKVKVSFSI